MPDTTLTYAEFAEEHGVTLSAQSVSRNPHLTDERWQADHWKVTLHRGDDTMQVHYSKGVGHEGAEPTAPEVLNCLALDASTIDNAECFESWADEFGYDTNSRAHEATFEHCRKQAAQLREFLGDLYDTLLTAEEE